MSIQIVREYMKQFGIEDRIMEFDSSSATVAEAAATVGAEEKEIAKTMSFKVDGQAIVIVLAGDARIDNKKYKEQFHAKAAMLKGDEVEALTNHAAGGVCPFGLPEGVKVYLDESLKRFEHVYPACGSGNSAIKLTIPELEQYSRFDAWVNVGKDWA